MKTTQRRCQSYSQLLQRRAQGGSQSGIRFSGQYRECRREDIKLSYGRTPFSLARGWGRCTGLEYVERRATSPRTTISRLGQRYELHVSCVRGFEDRSFNAIAVYIISESVYLFRDGSRVRQHVSGGGKGLRLPNNDEKGNDGPEKKLTLVCPKGR